jgi:hypothetical protein
VNLGETLKRLQAALFLILSATVVRAATIIPDSYDLPNGETGNWIYHDDNYLPCPAGACNTSLQNLSGGTGKLTDGIATPDDWYGSGQPFGTSVPWVGWNLIDPTITFYFSGSPSIAKVGLYFDNTPGNGDVRLPDSVDIAGVNYDLIPDWQYGPRWIYFDIPATPAGSLDITLHRDNANWMMLGEVSFESSNAVPEPGTIGLFAAGILGLVVCRYRRVS